MASSTALLGHHIMATKRVMEMTKHPAGAETRESRVATRWNWNGGWKRGLLSQRTRQF